MTTAYLRKKAEIEHLKEVITGFERRPDNQNRFIEKEVDLRLNQKQKDLIRTIEERDNTIKKLDEYKAALHHNVDDLQNTLRDTRRELLTTQKQLK